MTPSYSYKIYKDDKLVIEKYTGKIDKSFIKASQIKLKSDKDFRQSYGILVDFRDCKMDITPDELDELINHHETIFNENNARTSILISGTKETALSMLVADKLKTRFIKLFSTEECAYEWLGIDQNKYCFP